MVAPAAPAGEDEKKVRRYPIVLVRVPGFPSQDPGRRLVYSVRPNEAKARKMVKRLRNQLHEYQWDWEWLTAAEAREIRLAPFTVSALGVTVKPKPVLDSAARLLRNLE